MRKILLSATALAALTLIPASAQAQPQECVPGQDCPAAGPSAPPSAAPAPGGAEQPAMPEAAPPAMAPPAVQDGQAPAPDGTQPAPQGGTTDQPGSSAPAGTEPPKPDQSGSPAEGQPEGDSGSKAGGQDQPGTSGTDQGEKSTETTVEVTEEQRVEIRNVVKEVNVTRIDIDFEINIGVSVPRTIVLHPLPPRIIEIVPAYRGYLFFILTNGTIIIVHPGDLVIVTVINV